MSMFEEFDLVIREHGEEVMKHAACAGIIHHLGALIGMGVAEAEIHDFFQQTMQGLGQMASSVEPGKSVGENLDLILRSKPSSKPPTEH